MVFGSFLDCDNSNNLEVMGKEVEDVEEGEILILPLWKRLVKRISINKMLLR
jgi:hypothetical protein